MKKEKVQPFTRFLLAGVGVGAVILAFLRGNYLLGFWYGIVSAIITLALAWLVTRSRTTAGGTSVARLVVVALVAMPIGCFTAFPASFNPDMQLFIDKQASDRRARAELAAVFASDPAFGDLSLSSIHLKIINLTIKGSLGTRKDMDRLQSRIAAECPSLRLCLLHWDVRIRGIGQRIDGLEREL